MVYIEYIKNIYCVLLNRVYYKQTSSQYCDLPLDSLTVGHLHESSRRAAGSGGYENCVKTNKRGW